MTSADSSAESESRRLRVAEPTGTGSSAPRPPELPFDNLPLEPSSFVGREREIAEVEGLLSDRRLLTLRGRGGAGKTRLALAIAQEMVEEFESGVWWVELAPLSDPELVVRATAAALGVREAPDRSPTQALVEHLKGLRALLILDNCEHLIEGVRRSRRYAA